MKPVLHSRPWITEEDCSSVARVLRSEMIGQGDTTRAFEAAVAEWLGAAGGVAVGSGSAALTLALQALGAGANTQVVVPSYVCASVVEAVLTAGAEPVLCDVGPHWVMTPENVAPLLGARTRTAIVPHMYGIFADVAAFRALGIAVVEDCAQGFGSPESHRIAGDIAMLSFHPTKCLTTGEGGMALSASAELVDRMRAIRDGAAPTLRKRLFAPLADSAAALGLSQLARYREALRRRAELAAAYRRRIQHLAAECLPDAELRTMHFRLPLRIAGGVERVGDAFLERGVVVRRGVDALLHRSFGHPDTSFPCSTGHFESTVSLPLYPALTDQEFERCARAAEAVLGAAS